LNKKICEQQSISRQCYEQAIVEEAIRRMISAGFYLISFNALPVYFNDKTKVQENNRTKTQVEASFLMPNNIKKS
jgi:hypothetical protein